MADIKKIAEALCGLSAKEVNELATVMKDEYGIEAAAAEIEKEHRLRNDSHTTSPKAYGIWLMSKRHKRN